MSLAFDSERVVLHLGDCLDVMRSLPEASVDAVVTDPPYSLGFMGRAWDKHGDGEDVAFGYYLAGLTDGEGSFRVQRQERSGNATFQCAFTIKLRRDDRAILEQARRFIGFGIVRDVDSGDNAQPQTVLVVQDKEGALRLAELFTKYPLRAKKARDFEAWREAVYEWYDFKRGNRWTGPGDWSRLEALKARIERAREYREIPWSGNAFQDSTREWGEEAYRVLKPGGHLVAFGAPRQYHRLAAGIEDAGFEIRDSLVYMFGSGFPKSLDVSKAIDSQDAVKARLERARRFQRWMVEGGMTPQRVNELTSTDMGHHLTTHPTQPFVATAPIFDLLRPELPDVPEWVEALVRERTVESENVRQRPVVRAYESGIGSEATYSNWQGEIKVTRGHSPEAVEWEGWGTALKPAYEPIVLARKPLIGTVAANVLAHGTGGLNIDGCRIEGSVLGSAGGIQGYGRGTREGAALYERGTGRAQLREGRWPANVLLDEESAALLDQATGDLPITGYRTDASRSRWSAESPIVGEGGTNAKGIEYPGDRGGASRFFYTAKASRSEREAGVDVEPSRRSDGREKDIENPRLRTNDRRNDHPTVKPVDLMRWLCRLVTPPGGTILDCFLGSGTTAMAALDEGFACIGIEREERYIAIAQDRITHRHLLEVETRAASEALPQGRLL